MSRVWQYQQLTDFLVKTLPSRYQKHLYSWIDNGRLINEGKQLTENGLILSTIEYDAIIYFDDFPFVEINPEQIMASLQIWLNEHSKSHCFYDEYQTPFDLSLMDDKTAKLQFTVKFREPLEAVKSETGNLIIDGNRYQLENVEICTAEQVNVKGNIAHWLEIKHSENESDL